MAAFIAGHRRRSQLSDANRAPATVYHLGADGKILPLVFVKTVKALCKSFPHEFREL
jgi:hypothetical protein